jgi:hypothetical protein
VRVLEGVEVRPADAAGPHLDEDLARLRARLLVLPHLEHTVLRDDRSHPDPLVRRPARA